MKKISTNELESMVNNRLSMQSTARSLEFYRIYGCNSYKCIFLPTFLKVLKQWPEIQQNHIFKILCGIHWKQLRFELGV